MKNLFIIELAYLLIICLISFKIVIQSFVNRNVKNDFVITLLVVSIIFNLGLSFLNKIYIIKFIEMLIISAFFAFFINFLKMWSSGNAKFYLALSASIPITFLKNLDAFWVNINFLTQIFAPIFIFLILYLLKDIKTVKNIDFKRIRSRFLYAFFFGIGGFSFFVFIGYNIYVFIFVLILWLIPSKFRNFILFGGTILTGYYIFIYPMFLLNLVRLLIVLFILAVFYEILEYTYKFQNNFVYKKETISKEEINNQKYKEMPTINLTAIMFLNYLIYLIRLYLGFALLSY